MKKNHPFFLAGLFIALLFMLLAAPRLTAQTVVAPSGSGTAGDPYLIATLNNLYWITQNSSEWATGKVYKQTANIDASTTSTWDGGKGFLPIGDIPAFAGSYDGQSFAISNLFINRTKTGEGSHIGLFGYTSGATLTNIKLINVDITGNTDYGSASVGALVGYATGGTVARNCSTSGFVTSPQQWAGVGGLIGYREYGCSITNCSSSCSVSGTGNNPVVGGLIGAENFACTTNSSYSNGTVSVPSGSSAIAGGLVGELRNLSYNSAYCSITNCYSISSVSGGYTVGGLVGSLQSNTTVTNSYSVGLITGSTSSSVGGLIGSQGGTVSNSFWDTQTSGKATSNGGIGKTTTEMKTPSTFIATGWDGTIWNMGDGINNGYPYLDWQNPNGTPLSGSSGSWTKVGLSGKNIYGIYSNGESIFIGTDANGIYKGTGSDSNWVNTNSGLTSTGVLCITGGWGFLYAGTSGGVFRSDDSAKTWTVKNTGLTSTFVRTIATRGAGLYAGTEEGGAFRSLDNAGSWTQLSISPTVSTIRIMIENNQILYAGTSDGGVFFSTDAGSNWSAANTGLTNLFVRALAFVGTNLFAGTPSGVFKSTDSGNSWSLVNTGITYTSVETFAVSGTTLYAGTGGGGVFKTTDNGMQWSEFNAGLTNKDVRTLYCTQTNLFAGTLGGGLYKATIVDSLPSTSGLTAYYPFNGNANDESGNSNHGIVYTAALTSDRFENSNKAYYFNGQTDYISSANQLTNPFPLSISLWFRTNSTSGGKLFGFGDSQTGSSTNHDRNIYLTNSGNICFGVWTGNYQVLKSVNLYNDGKWHHVAGLISNEGLALYIDGSFISLNSSVTSAENTSGYWRIGYDNLAFWPDEPTSRFFEGSIDDIRIYDRSLTDPEISALYSENTVGIKDEKSNTPVAFTLKQNYPNPFNPTTSIQYAVGNIQFVSLKVFDVLGNEIATLVNEEKLPGTYEVEFSSKNAAVSSGVYFYQLCAGSFIQTKKMIVLK
jgi:hypothetical protein